MLLLPCNMDTFLTQVSMWYCMQTIYMTLIVKCSLNISYFFHRILVFVYIENIITLSENIKYICTSFRNGCLLCFAENANKFDIFRRIMVLSWNVKSTRTTAKLSKKSKNKRRSYSCFMLSYLKSVLILLSFFFYRRSR